MIGAVIFPASAGWVASVIAAADAANGLRYLNFTPPGFDPKLVAGNDNEIFTLNKADCVALLDVVAMARHSTG